MDARVIALQLSSQRTIPAALIRWRLGSEWSHIDAITPEGRWFGARLDGVKERDPYPVSRVLRFDLDIPADEFWHRLYTQAGKPYDYTALWGFWCNRRKWTDPEAWYCFELMAYGLLPWMPFLCAYPLIDGDILRVACQTYQHLKTGE